MTGKHPGARCTRRVALGRLGLATLGAALVATTDRAAAADRAAHPMIGHWLAVTPLGPAHVVFDPDGTMVMAWPQSEDPERGTFSYTPSAEGFWQPVSPRGLHFAVVRLESEVGGAVTGTTSLESIVVASADGGSSRSEGTSEPVAAWASVGMTRLVVQQTAAKPALSGIRMLPELPA